MGLHPRYAVALALGIALAVAATVWTISESRDRTGLAVTDLLRVEPSQNRRLPASTTSYTA